MGHERGLWVEHVDADLDGILINGADLNLGEGVIGLVTTPGVDPDEILALLAGERQFETGTVRLDGQPTSSLAQRGLVRHVPVEGVGFQASPQELFQAVAPGLDLGDVKDLLVDVGLAELAEQDSFLEGSMGHVGDALTTAQRQRLALAVGLAAEPAALLVGPIYPVVEPDAILSLLESIARRLPRCAVITVRTPEVADLVDRVLFADGTTLLVGHHHDLLIGNERYAALWQSHVDRLLPAIDLSVLGIDDDAADSLRLRLITERCDAGEMLYRQGDEADRLLFIVSGRVEIQVAGADGSPRVVAVLGPGDHCGDLTLMPGERRVETAVAREACVLRSLSRHAIEAGHLGILDRTPIERRVLVSLLREGAADEATLTTRLNIEEGAVVAALALLRRDNAVTIAAGKFSAVLGTTRSRLSGDLAEKLGF